MNDSACGCGPSGPATPPVNRPGLSALDYRVGTHTSFLDAMRARLSTVVLTPDEMDGQRDEPLYPLLGLTTRAADDPSMALLDAWAVVADVLTFYQERVANEGFLRTATERRSILELARLVGYNLRPGVAASVYLAYSLDQNQSVTIPKGSRAQSVPGPGERMQSFETSEDLQARGEWNELLPRTQRPQNIKRSPSDDGKIDTDQVIFDGTATNLKPGDRLLFDFADGKPPVVRTVEQATVDAPVRRTIVALQRVVDAPAAATLVGLAALGPVGVLAPSATLLGSRVTPAPTTKATPSAISLDALVKQLIQPPGSPPADRSLLERDFATAFGASGSVRSAVAPSTTPAGGGAPRASASPSEGGTSQPTGFPPLNDALAQLLTDLDDRVDPRQLATALANAIASPAPTLQVYALRKKASVFGNNARPPAGPQPSGGSAREWLISGTESFAIQLTPTNQSLDRLTIGGDAPITNVDLTGKGTLTFDFPLRRETVQVSVSRAGSDNHIDSASFYFVRGRVQIRLATGVAAVVDSEPGSTIGFVTHQSSTSPLIFESSITVNAESPNVLSLDAVYDRVDRGGWVVIDRPGARLGVPQIVVAKLDASPRDVTRTDYGLTLKTTQITLPVGTPWLDLGSDDFSVIRNTTVYLQSELLPLGDESVDTPVGGDTIELDGLVTGLEPGRWLVVTGERVMVGTHGVQKPELAMLSRVEHKATTQIGPLDASGVYAQESQPRPGDTLHSFLVLANKLGYSYQRGTVKILANVAEATHGETCSGSAPAAGTSPPEEVLGNGDGSQPLQTFTLRQSPLTFLPAPTPSGAQDTLEVRIDDILWEEADNLVDLGPTDRKYVTRVGDDDSTTVHFGDGTNGARLPTGAENVKATYRFGIGSVGNVKAGQISLLATRPLGVKGVTNPLAASGGADREDVSHGRDNASRGLSSLAHLVSLSDYADFARTFAGFAKARASMMFDNGRRGVKVVVAGVGDIPVAETSDLYRNLSRALRDNGDPALAVTLVVRTRLALVIGASVRVLPAYSRDVVYPAIEAALYAAFSFEKRDLGQPAYWSEAVRVVQGVEGVASVDLNTFTSFSPDEAKSNTPPDGFQAAIRPAPNEIAYLSPSVDATLILTVTDS